MSHAVKAGDLSLGVQRGGWMHQLQGKECEHSVHGCSRIRPEVPYLVDEHPKIGSSGEDEGSARRVDGERQVGQGRPLEAKEEERHGHRRVKRGAASMSGVGWLQSRPADWPMRHK